MIDLKSVIEGLEETSKFGVIVDCKCDGCAKRFADVSFALTVLKRLDDDVFCGEMTTALLQKLTEE